MISLSECRSILNTRKGKKNYTDAEIAIIRDLLIRLAEIEYLQYENTTIINNLNSNIK